MLRAMIFLVISSGLVVLSRACLLAPRTHGFYRFFAWELILALFLLNVPHWFRDPISPMQIVSWVLLSGGTVLVIHGAYLLHTAGKPDPSRDDPHLIGIEKTTRLVVVGAYQYIRHPIYASLLLFAWGVFFKDPSWFGGVLAIMGSLFLVVAAKREEAECMRAFGSAYRTYMERTKMFVPFVA